MSSSRSSDMKIVDFDSLNKNDQELILEARRVKPNAYCPYSKFQVGAALRTECGKVFTGVNYESVSFTPTACAERVAIGTAVTAGYRRFVAYAVCAFQEKSYTTPCGVCRQAIAEFLIDGITDAVIYISKPDDNKIFITSLNELLPYRFSDLEEIKS